MKIAVIPARGGSKRITKKNIKFFLGKPIIAYSIENAINSNLFDKVIVSTDDDRIAKVAIEYGAEVPFIRPAELSDDFSGTHEVIGHAVEWLENDGKAIDYVCCLYATAPLIQISDVIKGFNLIKTGKWKSVIAATKFSYPIFRSFEKLPNGGLRMFYPEYYSSRSQDLPEAYHDAGQFYWASAQVWKDKPNGFSENSTIVELPNYLVQDIDTMDDWYRAENLFKLLIEKQKV
jgi:pseudaminic acid cytidylyltransferase